jgi:selenocysteine lyase/cysteine desulfurase
MNWERTRSFFPVTKTLAYLNHAGVAPISTRVAEALARYSAEAVERGAFDYRRYDSEIERVRERAARLIGAGPDEIAFAKNTSEGLGMVACGLDWQRGDRIVTCDLEFPSNVYAWWSLRPRGVETVLLRSRDGRLPLESVEEALRHPPRTRLLALSSVEFGSGARNDLPALGRLCRERGVLFCVDAIQSLGCFPLDVEECHVDFLAADGHKWLLSVEGCGLFFCRRALLAQLAPRVIGWRSVTNNLDFETYHFDLQPGAGRFEEGTPNTPGIYALGAAIDLLLELGVDAIGRRVLELTDRLCALLMARGAEIASPRAAGQASGIVAFRLPDEAPGKTAARLRAAGVFVVARRGCVRASPHFYNSPEDLDRLIRAL